MDIEIDCIKRNDIWSLTSLPNSVQPIGVKWIYKKKYNEKGELDKHKVRLVAKGYSQILVFTSMRCLHMWLGGTPSSKF